MGRPGHDHDHDHRDHARGHGHDHGHHGHSRRAATPRSALAIALGLTGGFMIVEAIVGFWSGSLALLADAGHMLGDTGSLILSLVIAQIALLPRSRKHTFGYRRAEVMGALANASALFVAAFWIVLSAVERLRDPPAVAGTGMLVTATLGLGVNIVSAWVLSSRGGGGINVRSAMYHVLSDALGSIAAITAGLLLLFANLRIADPIASIAISILIALGAFRLLRETVHVLMEGTPHGIQVAEVEKTIASVDGVASVHDLHIWALTPGVPMLTAHVVLQQGHHGTDVVRLVAQRIAQAHRIEHVTIQPEVPREDVVVPLRVRRTAD